MPVARRELTDDFPERLEAATSYTYAIYDGESIKIGKSTWHPKQRLDVLQTGNPRVLKLVAYSVALTESVVHRHLSRWRVRGEWFEPSVEVLRYISTWCWVDGPALADLTALAELWVVLQGAGATPARKEDVICL